MTLFHFYTECPYEPSQVLSSAVGRSKEDKKGYRLTGYSRLGWKLSGDGPHHPTPLPPTNGTTRDRAETMLSCTAQPLRSKSLGERGSQGGLSGGGSLESVPEGERLWFIYSLSANNFRGSKVPSWCLV